MYFENKFAVYFMQPKIKMLKKLNSFLYYYKLFYDYFPYFLFYPHRHY